MDFEKADTRIEKTRVILKISKSKERSPEKGLAHQRKILAKTKGLVPKVGDIYRGKTGLAYFEEYIPGPTLLHVSDHGVLSPQHRHQSVQTAMELYSAMGKIVRDFHIKNFVVMNYGETNEKFIVIDFDDRFYRTPRRILEVLLAYFGAERWVIDPAYSDWKVFGRIFRLGLLRKSFLKSYAKDEQIFSSILETLGKERGLVFLKEGLEAYQKRYPNLWKTLSRKFRHAHWRLNNFSGRKREIVKLKRNVQFAEYVKNLERFLDQVPA